MVTTCPESQQPSNMPAKPPGRISLPEDEDIAADTSPGQELTPGDKAVVPTGITQWNSVLNKWRSKLLVDHGLNKTYFREKESQGLAVPSDPAPTGNVSIYRGRKWINDVDNARSRKKFEIYRDRPHAADTDDSTITKKILSLEDTKLSNNVSAVRSESGEQQMVVSAASNERAIAIYDLLLAERDHKHSETVTDNDLNSSSDCQSLSLFEQSLGLPNPIKIRELVRPRSKLRQHFTRTTHIPHRDFSTDTHTFCGYRRIPDEVWKNYFEQRSVLTDVYSNTRCLDRRNIMAQLYREGEMRSEALENGEGAEDVRPHIYDCTGRDDAGSEMKAITYKHSVVPPPEPKVEVVGTKDKELEGKYGVVLDNDLNEKPTVGFSCKFKVIVPQVIFNKKEDSEKVQVYIECRTPEDLKEFAFVRSCCVTDAVLSCEFYPQQIGDYVVKVSPLNLNGFHGDEYSIMVHDNVPLVSFNDGEYWPVAVAVDEKWFKKMISVYIAYSHHITEFTDDGNKIRRLTKLTEGYYNDLAVGSKNYILAASISCLTGMREHTYRFQCVHIYHLMSGRLMYKIGGEFPFFRFETPIVNLTTKGDDHVVLMDRARVCEVNIHNGDMKSRLDLEKPGAVSGVCCYGDKYYVTDAAGGFIKVYNDIGLLQAHIPVLDGQGDRVTGLVGVSVDSAGLILVADCVSGAIRVFNQGGALMRSIESKTGGVHWPLDLDVTSTGHVFVVDHGHVCIKKFRYV